MVCMTYPEIGNVGINREDAESARVYVEGFIVKDYLAASVELALGDVARRLSEARRRVGIEGIDTRALVRHIRTHGAQEAVISSVDLNPDAWCARPRRRPDWSGATWSRKLPAREPYDWDLGDWELGQRLSATSREELRDAPLIVALDYGIKRNILRRLISTRLSRQGAARHCDRRRHPRASIPTGFFSPTVRPIPRRCPMRAKRCAACSARSRCSASASGHQILGLALGGKTYKLDFGHHGANHPVKDLRTGKVEITSQNHGFAVDADSVRGRAELSHRQSQRPHRRRLARRRRAVLLRAVPSGGLAGSA